MSKSYRIKVKSRKIQVVLDKILLARLFKRLHGRFWGIYGLLVLNIGLMVCFLIKPELWRPETAFSEFSKYSNTAPYYMAGMFAAAFGLWKWRNYLTRTLKNTALITLLITLIVAGLYLIAFMPLGWNEAAEKLHYFGVALVGVSISLTVMADIVLLKTRKKKHFRLWQFFRISSFLIIVSGLVVTALSANRFGKKLDIALIGEYLMLFGFGLWVILKTYLGEGKRSAISKLVNKVIIFE